MAYFAGLDVSVKETRVCIVDDAGKIVREARVASEPEALLQVLTNTIYRFKRVGLEAGPLSQWLYSVLAEFGGCLKRARSGVVRSTRLHAPTQLVRSAFEE
jgi:transposase